jgi:hypothetical protein
MIRFRRLTPRLLDAQLVDQCLANAHERYRLRVWREERAGLAAIKAELIAYVDEAFEYVCRRIRRGFEDDLSPFNDPTTDPAANNPALLHRITLQGYLGETFVVLAVEHWGAHDYTDWAVPAFCFTCTIRSYSILRRSTSAFLPGKLTIQIASPSAGPAAPVMMA